MNINEYRQEIEELAKQLGKPSWIEVDWDCRDKGGWGACVLFWGRESRQEDVYGELKDTVEDALVSLKETLVKLVLEKQEGGV